MQINSESVWAVDDLFSEAISSYDTRIATYFIHILRLELPSCIRRVKSIIFKLSK